MADAIAVLILALQYSAAILAADLYFRTVLPRSIVMGIFIALAAIAVVVWHAKKQKTPAEWGLLAGSSVLLGILFFGGDWLTAYSNGYSDPFHFPGAGGPLGLTLTALVCPCATMVCVAGSVRALYVERT